MRFGLDDTIIKAIEQVFEANPKVDKAIIFGSRAKGNYKPDSDIDIALKGYDLNFSEIVRLLGALEEQGVHYKVDLIAYDSIKEKDLVEHIDRIGIEVFSRWKEFKLKDVLELGNGKTRPKSEGDYLVYGGNGILGTSNNYNYSGKTIIIGRVGAYCGSVYYEDKPIWVSDNALVAKTRLNYNSKYFYYYLTYLNLNHHAQGSSHPLITQTLLNELEIYIPCYKEDQFLIAEKLSLIDCKIEILQKQNKTLEQLAETLFRQWFVSEEEGEVGRLEDFIYFEPREKIDKKKEYRFFDMKCLSNTDMNISEGEARITQSGSNFRNNDTLLAKITPCLENGKTGFVIQLEENEVARGSTEFIVMRSKGIVSPYWIYCLARDNDFRESAIQSMTGTSGRQRVQIDLLKSLEVKVDKQKMDIFHHTVTPFFKKIKSNQTQIHSFTKLRGTLLPKLMSGEIRVTP